MSRFLFDGEKYKKASKHQKEWLLCPTCKNKTRTRLRQDTTLLNLLLFCPKCKQEILVNVRQFNTSIIGEPATKMQSR